MTDTNSTAPAPVGRVGTQLLISPDQRARQEVLAAVLGVPLAEVGRQIFTLALPQLEAEHTSDIAKLAGAARVLNRDVTALTKDMIKHLVKLEDLYDGDYPVAFYAKALEARDARRAAGIA